MLWLIVVLVISSITLLSLIFIPVTEKGLKDWDTKKQEKVEKHLDTMFYDKSPRQIMRLYYILPPIFAVAGYFLMGSYVIAFVGGVFGLFIPNVIINIRAAKRRSDFNNQILDAIMIISSCLKGGLSLLQSLEVVMEEMRPPMCQEIGLVVRENKMGVTLEESLRHLEKKMSMEELSLVVNSILVARETGGDLTKVLSRLTTTIRDNRKLKDSIKTLTLQGRLQGIIMSALPFMFVWWVINFNKKHFDIMFQNDTGRMLLIAAVVLQIIGMFLIRKFSIIKI